jgi:outer membrane protein assembly factor BamB
MMTDPAASNDTWPMFGHDRLHSGVSPVTAIAAWTARGLTIRWSRPLNSAQDQPSPAVAHNALRYETLVYEVTQTGAVSAFNAATGRVVWRRKVAPFVSSSPAVYGNTVYFGNSKGALEALKMTAEGEITSVLA